MTSLFDLIPEPDICANRHRDNSRSAAAFEGIKPQLSARRAAVLEVVRRLVDATGEEVADAMGVPQNATSGRISELARDGLIVPTGELRNTRSGNKAKVWKIAKGS